MERPLESSPGSQILDVVEIGGHTRRKKRRYDAEGDSVGSPDSKNSATDAPLGPSSPKRQQLEPDGSNAASVLRDSEEAPIWEDSSIPIDLADKFSATQHGDGDPRGFVAPADLVSDPDQQDLNVETGAAEDSFNSSTAALTYTCEPWTEGAQDSQAVEGCTLQDSGDGVLVIDEGTTFDCPPSPWEFDSAPLSPSLDLHSEGLGLETAEDALEGPPGFVDLSSVDFQPPELFGSLSAPPSSSPAPALQNHFQEQATRWHFQDDWEFFELMDTAVKLYQHACANPRKKVRVLFISWDESDLEGVDEEMDDLEQVLTKSYRYPVERWKIPSSNDRGAQAINRLNQFTSGDDKDSLFILYYAGHGQTYGYGSSQWISHQEGGRELDVATVLTTLGHLAGDVLMLLDCCHAGVESRPRSEKGGRIDCLAASGMGELETAPAPGNNSFTTALVSALGELAKCSQPFSDRDLCAKVTNYLRDPKPYCLRRGDRLVFNERDEVVTEPPKRRPHLQWVSSGCDSGPNLMLSPLPAQQPPETALAQTSPQQPPRPGSLTSPATYALVAFRLPDHSGDARDFDRDLARFTMQMPPETRFHIVDMFESRSRLLILRVPMLTWSLLPRHPAVTFIGEVLEESGGQSFRERMEREMKALGDGAPQAEEPGGPRSLAQRVDAPEQAASPPGEGSIGDWVLEVMGDDKRLSDKDPKSHDDGADLGPIWGKIGPSSPVLQCSQPSIGSVWPNDNNKSKHSDDSVLFCCECRDGPINGQWAVCPNCSHRACPLCERESLESKTRSSKL